METQVNISHDNVSQRILNIRQRLRKMDIEQKMLRQIFTIEKTVLHSCLYHDKNITDAGRRFNEYGLAIDEQQIIFDSMGLRHKLGKQLLKELEDFINEFK